MLYGKLLMGIFIIVEDNTRKKMFKKKVRSNAEEVETPKKRRDLRDSRHRLARGNNKDTVIVSHSTFKGRGSHESLCYPTLKTPSF